MAYDFPSDLLVQVQILLRREAGLEYYNPSDSSLLSNPPTLEEVIANFEPSSDCLRCKHCKGALLRGSQSIICVYCGREPDMEFPPEPISFKSTVGYRWLLESLGLDGSEIVGPPIEDSQTNKGRLSINESSLSDFLDLEVKWPNELERFGVTVSNEAQMMGKGFLNSDDGVGFDDYFSGARRESVSSISNEQLVPNETSRSKESKASQGEGNVRSFENQQSSGASGKPDEIEQSDSFSGWEANFQSANSGTQQEDSKSSVPLNIPALDYASHMDSVFGPVKDLKEGRSTDITVSPPPRSNSITNDPWSNSNHVESAQAKESEANIVLEDSGMVSKSEDPSPTSLYQFQENQWQSIISEVPDIGKTVAEDFYDACKDFRSSTSAENYQWQAIDTVAANSMKNGENKSSSDAWDDFILRSAQGSQHQTDTVKVSPDVSFDAWNGFTSSSVVQGNQLQTRSTSDIEEMTATVGDYSVDAWNDFKSLTSAHQNQQITVGDNNQDDSLGFLGDPIYLTAEADHQQIREIKSPATDATMEGESTLTIWNDFMGTSFGLDTEQETNHMEVADDRTKSEVHNIADVQDDLMSSSNAGNNFKQISSTKSFDKNRIGFGGDSFDEWNDFTSSSNASDYKTISKDISVSAWDNFPSFSSQQQASCEQVPGNRTIAEEDLYNSWSDFRSLGNSVDNNLSGSTSASDNKTISDSISTSSTMPHDSQKQTSSTIAPEKKTISGYIASENKMTLEGNNLFNGDNSSVSTSANASDNQLKSSGTAMGNKTTSKYEDSLDDVWTDFTSSMAIQENHLHDDDPFDAWNVFVSSSDQPGNHNLASSSVINLFSSTSNSQDLGFNSHLQPELFSGTFRDHNSSALLDVLPSEAPVLVRMNNDNAEAEGNAEMNQMLKGTSNTKSSDAETLISQMHDLSFMLESSLSIPKR